MNCIKCNHMNREGAKFCTACGTEIVTVVDHSCTECGENVEGKAFCQQCGTKNEQFVSVSAAVSHTAQQVTNKVKDVVHAVKTDVSAEKIVMPNTTEVASEVKKVGNAVFGELSHMKLEQDGLLNQVVILPAVIANAVALVISTVLSFTVLSAFKLPIPTIYTLLRGHAITLDVPKLSINADIPFKSFGLIFVYMTAIYISTYMMHKRTVKIETKIASILASAGISSVISAIIGFFAGGEVNLSTITNPLSLLTVPASQANTSGLLMYSANPFMIFMFDFILFAAVAAVAVYASGEFKFSGLIDRTVKFSGTVVLATFIAGIIAIAVGLPMGVSSAGRKFGFPVTHMNLWTMSIVWALELIPNFLGLAMGTTSHMAVGQLNVMHMSLFGGVSIPREYSGLLNNFLPTGMGSVDRLLSEIFTPMIAIVVVLVLVAAIVAAHYFGLTVKQLKSKYLSLLVNASAIAFVLTFIIGVGHRVITIPQSLMNFLPIPMIRDFASWLVGFAGNSTSQQSTGMLEATLGVNIALTFIMLTIVGYIVLLVADFMATKMPVKK